MSDNPVLADVCVDVVSSDVSSKFESGVYGWDAEELREICAVSCGDRPLGGPAVSGPGQFTTRTRLPEIRRDKGSLRGPGSRPGGQGGFTYPEVVPDYEADPDLRSDELYRSLVLKWDAMSEEEQKDLEIEKWIDDQADLEINGWEGNGNKPIRVAVGHHVRPISDGAGRGSLGSYLPWHRRPGQKLGIFNVIMETVKKFDLVGCFQRACKASVPGAWNNGKDPFPEEARDYARSKIGVLLEKDLGSKVNLDVSDGFVLRLDLQAAIERYYDDRDWEYPLAMRGGVRLGAGFVLPRVACMNRVKEWTRLEEYDGKTDPLGKNLQSLDLPGHLDEVIKILHKDQELNRVLPSKRGVGPMTVAMLLRNTVDSAVQKRVS